MSSDKKIRDEIVETIDVLETLYAEDVLIRGNLVVQGTITPNVPGSLPLTGPLNTTWDPLTVTSLVSDSGDIDAMTIETLVLTDPNIANNTDENNVNDGQEVAPLFPTQHSTLHLLSNISGTFDDITLKSTQKRSTACNKKSYAIEGSLIFDSADLFQTEDGIGVYGKVVNLGGGNTSGNNIIGVKGEILHGTGSTIVSARGVHAYCENSGGGEINTCIGMLSEVTGTAPLCVINEAIGMHSSIQNIGSSIMGNAQVLSLKYENGNASAANAAQVIGLDVGTSTSAQWSAGTGAVTETRGISIGVSCNVGVTHNAIYIEDGAGHVRTSGRKRRYRLMNTLASDDINADDDVIFVDSSVTGTVNLPQLAALDECIFIIKNIGGNQINLAAQAGETVTDEISLSTIVMDAYASVEVHGTSSSTWRVTQRTDRASSVTMRDLNTSVTESVVSSDDYLFIESSIVVNVNLPSTLNLTGKILSFRNEGGNAINIIADGVDLIDDLSAAPASTSYSLAAFSGFKIIARGIYWKEIV